MRCEYCDNEFEGNFCPGCGAPAKPQNTYQQNTSTLEGNAFYNYGNVSVTSAPPQQPVVSSGKPVNKVAYCLFAIFLGGLGIHKFYAGKIGLGIAYLLFSWTFIPVFIAFVEFIIALCKPSDGNGNIYV